MLRSLLVESKSYQSYLKSELDVRKNKNPSYSLRAFARDLEVSFSYLSEILAGKGSLSIPKATHIMTRLQGSVDEVAYFRTLVAIESAKTRPEIVAAKEILGAMKVQHRIKRISLDDFHLIADWYHLAIVEFFEICQQPITGELIANRFNLKLRDAEEALNRLIRLKLICYDKKTSRLVLDSKSHIVGGANIPSKAIRHYHKQILKKAMGAIDDFSPEKREINTLVFSVNDGMKAEIKALLKNLQNDAIKISNYPRKCDEIYALSVQFFPLVTKTEA